MKWITSAVLVLFAVAAFSIWRARAAHARSVPVISVVHPITGDLASAVTATGTLYPAHSVDIKFDGQEIVERLNVKEGDHVRAGQVLAIMDTRVLNHTRLQSLETEAKDNSSLVEAQRAYNREKALFDNGIVARADFENVRATYQSLEHQRSADDQGVRETAQQMDRAVLRSPVNGTVVSTFVQAGEMLGSATAVAALGPNSSVSKPTNVLMTVVEDGPLEVYAGVNAADLASLSDGQSAQIAIDAFQPRIFHGRVRRISLEPVVVNNVTTYQAIVTLLDGDPRFRIGLPADVMLIRQLAHARVLVPMRAITTSRGGDAVCMLHPARSQISNEPQRVESTLTPVQVLAHTDDVAALATSLPSNAWIAASAADCRQSAQAQVVLRPTAFDPQPSLANAGTPAKQSQQLANLPPQQPKGWLQNILGL